MSGQNYNQGVDVELLKSNFIQLRTNYAELEIENTRLKQAYMQQNEFIQNNNNLMNKLYSEKNDMENKIQYLSYGWYADPCI